MAAIVVKLARKSRVDERYLMSYTSKSGKSTADGTAEKMPTGPEHWPELRCHAGGCQQVWSVDIGNGKLCSYHAWAESKEWPRITEEIARYGPWKLPASDNSQGVLDMRARLKPGFTSASRP